MYTPGPQIYGCVYGPMCVCMWGRLDFLADCVGVSRWVFWGPLRSRRVSTLGMFFRLLRSHFGFGPFGWICWNSGLASRKLGKIVRSKRFYHTFAPLQIQNFSQKSSNFFREWIMNCSINIFQDFSIEFCHFEAKISWNFVGISAKFSEILKSQILSRIQ